VKKTEVFGGLCFGSLFFYCLGWVQFIQAQIAVIVMKNSLLKDNLNRVKLIQSGKLKNECAVCGQKPEWCGKELILVLDHINGVQTDNKLKNLRLLCPNCNSQQYNYVINYRLSQKNNPKKPCERCGMPASINNETGLCKSCSSIMRRKTEWPSQEQLEKDLENMSFRAVGKKYGVSDNTVRRWAKKYNLLKGD